MGRELFQDRTSIRFFYWEVSGQIERCKWLSESESNILIIKRKAQMQVSVICQRHIWMMGWKQIFWIPLTFWNEIHFARTFSVHRSYLNISCSSHRRILLSCVNYSRIQLHYFPVATRIQKVVIKGEYYPPVATTGEYLKENHKFRVWGSQKLSLFCFRPNKLKLMYVQ